MTYGTMEKIQTVTVGAGGAANIEFTNIPQTYNDLKIVMSLRVVSGTDGTLTPSFNGSTANFSYRRLIGDGANASSFGDTTNSIGFLERSDFTANTFSNAEMYIPNYTSSTNKSFYVDSVTENNATTAFAGMWAALWSNTAAITSVRLSGVVNLAQHSTATLYGITRVPAGAKATGGVIYDDSSYWYHVFTSSGTFTPSQSLSCDVLAIAGGGGGDDGGGGAGGVIYFAGQSLTSTNYAVTIGAGGNGNTSGSDSSTNGSNSSFGALTVATGGGRGRLYNTGAGIAGGSGGGAPRLASGGNTGGTSNQSSSGATNIYANAGGNSGSGSNVAGGGGGSGAAGGNSSGSFPNGTGGNGGAGTTAFSSWGLATSTGENSGGTVYYAGGGGGFSHPAQTTGGLGGGGRGSTNTGGATAGLANTGGGGGGSAGGGTVGNGGSGIVIVRYAK